jgi:hypothetical protein
MEFGSEPFFDDIPQVCYYYYDSVTNPAGLYHLLSELSPNLQLIQTLLINDIFEFISKSTGFGFS